MKDSHLRGTGRTFTQMCRAPHGAVYVWLNHQLTYPNDLAKHIGRTDLRIVSPMWVGEGRWRGLEFGGVVVDHAARLTPIQLEALEGLRTTIRRRGL